MTTEKIKHTMTKPKENPTKQIPRKKLNYTLGCVICRTKWALFDRFENFLKRQFCNANFYVETAPSEKKKYTTTSATENQRKLSLNKIDF